MARIDFIENKLLNWARWLTHNAQHTQGFPKVNILGRFHRSGRYREATAWVPVDDVDASNMERLVRALPPHLQSTLKAEYVAGWSVKHMSEQLDCAQSTVHARIEDAHRRLQAALQG